MNMDIEGLERLIVRLEKKQAAAAKEVARCTKQIKATRAAILERTLPKTDD